jgi:hypothetical protein
MIRILTVLLCVGGILFGQENKAGASAKYFKLDFTVKELESGKILNSRSYSLSIISSPEMGGAANGAVRAGEKIPVVFGSQAANQIDVGVNIDCRSAKEVGDRLGMNISAEISSIAPSLEKTLPVVRQTRMNSFILIPLRKSTLIFSSDEPASKGQLQIELMATPLN